MDVTRCTWAKVHVKYVRASNAAPFAPGTRMKLWLEHGCSGHCKLLGARTKLCFGHGCSWNANEIMVWAWMFWSLYALGTPTRSFFGAWMLRSSYALETLTEGCSKGPCLRFILERPFQLI